MPSVILYDIPSREPRTCWSLNPWKTRLALNYKGIDYETEWVEYPDLAPTFKSFGLEPNEPEATRQYTSPAIKLDDGTKTTYMMDSSKIIAALETFSPTPSLHLESDILHQVEEQIPNVRGALAAYWMPNIPRDILGPRSAEYFYRTRAERIGKSLQEMEKRGLEKPDKGWEDARPAIEKMAELLKKNGGPFFMGSTVSYSDFVLVSMMYMYKKVDQSLFDRFVSYDPVFTKLFDACAQWYERNDK